MSHFDQDTAYRLMTDLQRDFGMSPEQAAGVVGSLSIESNGFRTLQEQGVPYRGGFGYAQWTGPRRDAYEAWARRNDLNPSSYEANYGYLADEFRQPLFSRWLQPTYGASDPATAAREFTGSADAATGFLRPGTPHIERRIGEAHAALDLWNSRAPQREQAANVGAYVYNPMTGMTEYAPAFSKANVSGYQAPSSNYGGYTDYGTPSLTNVGSSSANVQNFGFGNLGMDSTPALPTSFNIPDQYSSTGSASPFPASMPQWQQDMMMASPELFWPGGVDSTSSGFGKFGMGASTGSPWSAPQHSSPMPLPVTTAWGGGNTASGGTQMAQGLDQIATAAPLASSSGSGGGQYVYNASTGGMDWAPSYASSEWSDYPKYGGSQGGDTMGGHAGWTSSFNNMVAGIDAARAREAAAREESAQVSAKSYAASNSYNPQYDAQTNFNRTIAYSTPAITQNLAVNPGWAPVWGGDRWV